jgi:hypothetical protein
MDFDPRDCGDERDPRDDARNWDQRDRDDDDARTLGRGSSSHRVDEHHDERRDRSDDRHDIRDRDDPRDRDDVRWPERDRDPRERDSDARDVFTRGLDLPRGRDREIVHDARDREYMLRGSESRTLATVGAFRVVPARDLRDHTDRPADPRDGDRKKVERVPSGEELQQLFDSITVNSGDLVSEAERAWEYGYAAKSKARRARSEGRDYDAVDEWR